MTNELWEAAVQELRRKRAPRTLIGRAQVAQVAFWLKAQRYPEMRDKAAQAVRKWSGGKKR